MRILALDYGDEHIGVAISDEYQKIALIHGVWSHWKKMQVKEEIQKLIKQENIGRILVGLPLNLRGEKTEQTHKTEAFMCWLSKHISIPIDSLDERLTTRSAHARGFRSKIEKEDAVAAQILLQDYLEKNHA